MSSRLVQAAWDGDIASIRAFAAAGDVPNENGVARYADDEQERTWVGLPLAAAREQLPVLEALLELGARLDVTYGTRGTALHSAALNGHLDAVKFFLARGADPNARDSKQGTPLHAVAQSHPSRALAVATAEALLAAGADPRAKDSLGKMPSGRGGNEQVMAVLRKASSKARPPAAPKPKPIAPPPPATDAPPMPHAIINGALERATDDERPARIHLGAGPAVACPALGAIRIGLWMAELAAPYVRPDEREAAEMVLTTMRTFLGSPKDTAHTDAILRAAAQSTKDSDALGIVRRAAGGARTFRNGKLDLVWTSPRGAAQMMVALLRDGRGPMGVRAFLEALDQQILCAEMAGLTKNVKPPIDEPAVVRVFWRGTDMRIGRLATGHHAFVGKLKGRWTFTAGTLDDALGCVPDDWFALAAAFIASRSGASA